ncbi:MAG: hypothetical protein Q8S54_09265 [Bacteroidota bacterium]|nr:hypothetical protein [Odoribacter sp.]MDP3643362.1 hypothetical protein [Bacteroidota bacterium]
MKDIFTNKWIGISLLLVVLLAGFIPFFFVFKDSMISKSISDWGSFGSYLSGVIGVINVIVFIYITYLVSKLDDKRNKGQIDAQHKIVLSQFRQNELDKLSQKLDSALDLAGEEKYMIIHKISSAGISLTNFINRATYLFPIINDHKIKIYAENILSKYDQLIPIVEEIYGNPIESWQEEKLETKVQFVLMQTSVLIEELRKFILDDLNT